MSSTLLGLRAVSDWYEADAPEGQDSGAATGLLGQYRARLGDEYLIALIMPDFTCDDPESKLVVASTYLRVGQLAVPSGRD